MCLGCDAIACSRNLPKTEIPIIFGICNVLLKFNLSHNNLYLLCPYTTTILALNVSSKHTSYTYGDGLQSTFVSYDIVGYHVSCALMAVLNQKRLCFSLFNSFRTKLSLLDWENKGYLVRNQSHELYPY